MTDKAKENQYISKKHRDYCSGSITECALWPVYQAPSTVPP